MMKCLIFSAEIVTRLLRNIKNVGDNFFDWSTGISASQMDQVKEILF